MVLNCVKLVVKPQLKKYFFIIYNMPGNTFNETIFYGVIVGISYLAFDWLLKTADDRIELLEELEKILGEREKFQREQEKILGEREKILREQEKILREFN